MTPWATAGSISSQSRTDVAHPSTPLRLSPAMAKRVASTTPSCNFQRRVCTFPRKLTHRRIGFWAISWACRRREAVPMTELSGKFLNGFDRSILVNKIIVGIFSWQIAGQNGSIWQPSWDVFHGMNANIHFVGQRGHIQFLGKQSLSSQFLELSDLSRIISPCVFITQMTMAPS
jgi:hypothetical protein